MSSNFKKFDKTSSNQINVNKKSTDQEKSHNQSNVNIISSNSINWNKPAHNEEPKQTSDRSRSRDRYNTDSNRNKINNLQLQTQYATNGSSTEVPAGMFKYDKYKKKETSTLVASKRKSRRTRAPRGSRIKK